MRKTIAAAAVAALTATAVALAAPVPDTISATAKATGGGSRQKPKTVAASFTATVSGAAPNRAITPDTLRWEWKGIKTNGAAYPTCTAEMIDAVQSDAGCPKGSQIGSGKIDATLGPETDRTSAGISCVKDIKLYSAGKNAEVLYLYGDPALCAGVNYLPPTKLTAQKTATGQSIGFTVPENVGHPLPGLEGAINQLTLSYPKHTITKGGRKIGFLTSTGCGSTSTRGFTFTQTYPAASYDPAPTKVSAGSC